MLMENGIFKQEVCTTDPLMGLGRQPDWTRVSKTTAVVKDILWPRSRKERSVSNRAFPLLISDTFVSLFEQNSVLDHFGSGMM